MFRIYACHYAVPVSGDVLTDLQYHGSGLTLEILGRKSAMHGLNYLGCCETGRDDGVFVEDAAELLGIDPTRVVDCRGERIDHHESVDLITLYQVRIVVWV